MQSVCFLLLLKIDGIFLKSTGSGSRGMIYGVDGSHCSVVWPNNVAANHYRLSDVKVVGRRPDIGIGDLVERGSLTMC